MSASYLRSTARVAAMLAATILAACAVNSPPPPSGDGESVIDTIAVNVQSPDSVFFAADHADSSIVADYDRIFLEIHADLSKELVKLEGSGKGGTGLAEIQSIVKAAEEFYLEGKSLVAVKLLTEAELLLKQITPTR